MDIARLIDTVIIPEWPWRTCTGHRTLPEHSFLIFFLFVLGKLTSDAVHDSAVMEDDQVAFLPAMSIDVLSRKYLLLHAIDKLSDFFDVVHDCHFSGLGIACGQLVYAAPMDLKERSIWIERVSPDHLFKYCEHFART